VWKVEEESSEDMLDLLSEHSMVQWNEKAGRYQLHDLMRDFACQRVTAEEWNEAGLSHAQCYLDLLRNADDLYLDGGESSKLGLALVDLERGNIDAGQSWTAMRTPGDLSASALCSSYPNVGAHCLSLRQRSTERIRWREQALAAARALKNRAAERAHLGNLGSAYRSMSQYRRAIECYDEHLQITRELNDRRSEGQDLANLGNAYHSLGEHRRAIEYYQQCLRIAHEFDDRRREGIALGDLGTAYHWLGEHRRAIEYHEQALFMHRDAGDRRGEAIALGNLGVAHYRLGLYDQAMEFYVQQLEITREITDRHSEGNALWNISLALDEQGDKRRAIEYAEAALGIREEIGDPNAAKVRRQLEEWRRQ
jgi:tetratricopeptide (TPR) repeat protein